MTVHIEAQKGEIAKKVLMPGDPNRVKYIAEKYLVNPRLVNQLRGELAYTGTYKDTPVTIFSSGMGIGSMGIYSYELFNDYDVDEIIRIGTAGSYLEDLKVFDLLLATSCYSSTSFDEESGREDVKIINQIKDISTDFGFTNTKLDEIAELLHLQSIEHTDKELYGKDFLNYLKDRISDIKSSELYVGTIHSVKGLEYDNVFVMNVGSYSFKLNTEDEKNLFYVAITRAKNRLYIYELFDS